MKVKDYYFDKKGEMVFIEETESEKVSKDASEKKAQETQVAEEEKIEDLDNKQVSIGDPSSIQQISVLDCDMSKRSSETVKKGFFQTVTEKITNRFTETSNQSA